MAPRQAPAKDKLIGAAVKVVREKGFNATSVDDLCREAGVTKGAFFHHFPTKVDLGIAAAEAWKLHANELFGGAPFMAAEDPLDRILGYLEFRRDMLDGPIGEFTCLVGTMVQESYDTLPESLALHTQAVLQGAFILAKAADDPRAARDTADHLIRYVRMLFNLAPQTKE